mmetsp:Transcript_31019/g.89645  ORF Transcript_31019/g.89645 Transcript_31019/m.89645 type:complete len:204 (+) Transcript_31019:288-899(+)
MTSAKLRLNKARTSPVCSPRKIFAQKDPPGRSKALAKCCADSNNWCCTYSSKSGRPVTSGAPSHTTRSASSPLKCPMTSFTVPTLVMSPWTCTTPAIGCIGYMSTATMHGAPSASAISSSGAVSAMPGSAAPSSAVGTARLPQLPLPPPGAAPKRKASTWLQPPGAAQRSATFLTPFNRPISSSICKSLKAERARKPWHFASR